MALGVADLLREGHGIFRRRQSRQAVLAKRVEVVDGVPRQVSEPLLLALLAVALHAQTDGEIGADVEVVPALADRLDRLLHEDRVVGRARPRPWGSGARSPRGGGGDGR